MFTGLIQTTGTVRRVSRGSGLVLEIEAEGFDADLTEGESIAVNGACLTVARCAGKRFTADVLRESEERTGLAQLLPGERVNLERALKAGDALGGHIVQGHVDGRGTIAAIIQRGRDRQLRIGCGRVLAAGCVLKGSVAVDGVSLTVSGLGDDWLAVDIIPTTALETTLGQKQIGDGVNIECDVIGKYVARNSTPAGLSEGALRSAGFIT